MRELEKVDKAALNFYNKIALLERRAWHCCIRTVSHSLEKGGAANGKRTLESDPAFCGVFSHHLFDDDLHIPKSVLAARLDPGRLTSELA